MESTARLTNFFMYSGRALLVANLCKDQIEYHLQSLRSSKSIPFPGDVDVIVGGPPCQDVRHDAPSVVLVFLTGKSIL